jgi:hypothetical protein
MTQKHKRPSAPASKKLPKKAAKPAAASNSKAAHAPSHSKDSHSKDKGAAKHVEVKKQLVKGKAPEKAVAPADTKGKVVELKAAQKLAAARAAAAAPAPADG